MLILIEKLVCYQNLYTALGCTEEYSFIEWCYIHKKEIEASSERRKNGILRGKKDNREEGTDWAVLKEFYSNSESFAHLASTQEADIAIFFVDSNNDPFERRYKQIKEGLKKGSFDKTGVPMIPNKISEVWLLCCLMGYKDCQKLESLTNDKKNPEYPNKIDMPSFNRFREDFNKAINDYLGYEVC